MGVRQLQTSSERWQNEEILLLAKLGEVSSKQTMDDKIAALFWIVREEHKWNVKTASKLLDTVNQIGKIPKDHDDTISFKNLCSFIQGMNLPDSLHEKTEKLVRETRTRALSIIRTWRNIHSLGWTPYRL